MPPADAADPLDAGNAERPYPEQADNPVPRGGTPAEWMRWAGGLTALHQFGVQCVGFARGAVSFEMAEHVAPPNPNGAVHGGVLAAVIDDALGAAFVSAAPEDVLPATASLTVDYLRPAVVPLTIQATVTSVGRSLIHCEATVHGADGVVSTVARGIMSVRRIRAVPSPGS